jgi:superkiller protein 3
LKLIDARFGRTLRRAGLLTVAGLLLVSPAWSLKGRDLSSLMESLARDNLDQAHTQLEALAQQHPADVDVHVMLGEVHWRRGELRDAREHYEKALAIDAKDARAMAGLALVAISQDDFEAAQTWARKAIDRDKKLWLANYAMGRVLLEQGQIDAAYKHFEKGKDLKRREEGRDLFEAGMGLVGLAENDPEGAETNLIRARALAQNTVEHVMNLAAMYESTGQWGQAANVLEDMAEKVGSSPMLSYRLGRAYENLHRWNDALRQYQTTIQADSTFAPALAAMGHILLLDTSKTAHAANLLHRAVELHPTTASRLDYGIALIRLGRAEDAIPQLEAVLAASPEPAVKVALARAYLKADQDEKGAMMFEEDIDVRIEATASDLALAAGYWIQQKDFAKADEYLRKAEEKDADLADIAYRRGQIALYQKDYEAAVNYFQVKLKEEPRNAAALLNVAIALQGAGDAKRAAAAYRQVTELAPKSIQAWTQYGAVLTELGSNSEAMAAYDRALQLDPKSITALRGRGYLKLVEKQYAQAIVDLRQATQLDPQDAWGWVWLGQSLAANGDLQEARGASERAIELDPNNETAQQLLAQITQAGR